jgi:cysteine desulfurase family protein (TIGR01976 family)
VNGAPDEIVLGASSNMNARILSLALAPGMAPGDEIVVTDLDHECNIGPWRALESRGVTIREWRFDRDRLELTLAGLESVLGPRTRLVCFTQCSNLIGTIHDARAFVDRIHAAGALACVDGVAFAPHRRVDVKALDADFYFLSLYKLFGPHLGLLWGRRELLRAARGQYHPFLSEDHVPYKLEPGNVSHELAASLPGIPEYLLGLDSHHGGPPGDDEGARLARAFERIERHEAELARPLLEFLRDRRGVRVWGGTDADDPRRVPTISFTVEGRKSSEIPPRLDRERLAVRFGDFYSRRAAEALGLRERDGVVRVSLAHYNTPEEVGRLIAALDSIL